jgi:hypothetical protein
VLESFLGVDLSVLEAVARFVGRHWRHVVIAAAFVLGFLLFLSYSRQPTRQFFTAVVMVDEDMHVAPAKLTVKAEKTPFEALFVRGRRIKFGTKDSLQVGLVDRTQAAESVPSCWGGETCFALFAADTGYVGTNIVPRCTAAKARLEVRPVQESAALGFRLMGRAPEMAVRFVRPSQGKPCSLLLACERAFPRRDSADAATFGLKVRPVESLSGTAYSVMFGHCSVAEPWVAVDSTDVTSLRDGHIATRVSGRWYAGIHADSLLTGDSAGVVFPVSSQGRELTAVTLDKAASTLTVDASVCSLQIFAYPRRESITLPSRTRLNVSGELTFNGIVTKNGLRLSLNGTATSISYQYMPADPRWAEERKTDTLPIGKPKELLPSVLAEFNTRTVVLSAMVFALANLLGFIWNVFLKPKGD